MNLNDTPVGAQFMSAKDNFFDTVIMSLAFEFVESECQVQRCL